MNQTKISKAVYFFSLSVFVLGALAPVSYGAINQGTIRNLNSFSYSGNIKYSLSFLFSSRLCFFPQKLNKFLNEFSLLFW